MKLVAHLVVVDNHGMALDSDPVSRPRMSRAALLAVVAALLGVTACTAGSSPVPPSPSAPRSASIAHPTATSKATLADPLQGDLATAAEQDPVILDTKPLLHVFARGPQHLEVSRVVPASDGVKVFLICEGDRPFKVNYAGSFYDGSCNGPNLNNAVIPVHGRRLPQHVDVHVSPGVGFWLTAYRAKNPS